MLCVAAQTLRYREWKEWSSEGIRHGRSLIAQGMESLVPDLARLLLTTPMASTTPIESETITNNAHHRVLSALSGHTRSIHPLKETIQLMSAAWSKGQLWPFGSDLPRMLNAKIEQVFLLSFVAPFGIADIYRSLVSLDAGSRSAITSLSFIVALWSYHNDGPHDSMRPDMLNAAEATVEFWSKIVQIKPNSLEFQYELAASVANLAPILKASRDHLGALDRTRAAARSLRALVAIRKATGFTQTSNSPLRNGPIGGELKLAAQCLRTLSALLEDNEGVEERPNEAREADEEAQVLDERARELDSRDPCSDSIRKQEEEWLASERSSALQLYLDKFAPPC